MEKSLNRINKYYRIVFFIAIVLPIFTSSCSLIQGKKDVHLRIIETTDVHGAIFPYDFIRNRESDHSLSQVHNYVKSLRDDQSLEVILLDNGDILQGQPTVYYSNYEEEGLSHICSEVMNYMDYDAATIGNHDIEAGHAVYDKLIEEFDFPWLAANAINTETNEPYFKPYHIIQKKGVKVAIFGLITPGIPHWLPENLWDGIEFEDMVESAKYWVPVIQEKEKPDLLIGLFHSGHNFTYGGKTEETEKNDNASLLVAQQVPGFDIIFIGHDHDEFNEFVEGPDGKEVLVLDPKSSARLISVASIDFQWDKETKRYNKEISGKLVSLSDWQPDEEFLEIFKSDYSTIENYVSRPVGIFTEPILARKALFGDSPYMDLIHHVQLDVTGADISFGAPLSMNSIIDSGQVYVRDLFQIYRYENFLYSMELSGKEIKDYLEYSYNSWFNRMKDSSVNLLRFQTNEEGEIIKNSRPPYYRLYTNYYNYDSAEGIKYVVHLQGPEGSRVEIISMADGSAFSLDSKYKVAINSYRGNGGGGHLTRGAGIPAEDLSSRIVFSTDKDLRFYMMRWIENKGTVDPKCNMNWKVVPEKLWEKGQQNDLLLLFQ